MNQSLIIGGIISIVIVFITIFLVVPILIRSFEPPAPIYVEVSLENKCTVKDNAFMIVTNPNNMRAYFSNGKARLHIMSDWKIRLEANDKYPDFVYDGEEYAVKEKMNLIADCGTSKRMRSVFGAFREQFN
mgnify:CR=1 FL=1